MDTQIGALWFTMIVWVYWWHCKLSYFWKKWKSL